MKNLKYMLMALVAVLLVMNPFLVGYNGNLSIRSKVYTGTITGSKTIETGLSGSEVQSIFWSLSAGGTITVQVGVYDGNGNYLWATPAGTGPFTVVGGTPGIEALSIPVSERIRVTFTGTATGTLAVLDS